jgi:hypothetical protein
MLLQQSMLKAMRLTLPLAILLLGASCTSNPDGSHTTATTYVPPPPHQALTVVPLTVKAAIQDTAVDPTADPKKPLLIFALSEGAKFRVGESVPINFSVRNAKLRNDGGEFRVRYIVDDEEMKWVDKAEPFALAGWVPGEHTIRIELVGPDEWPFRNGDSNIVTRKIIVTP